MDPIKPLDSVGQLLRQKLASNSEKTASRSSVEKSTTAKGEAIGPRVSVGVLKKRIQNALDGLCLDDEEHQRKGLRIFFEQVLAWEFGDKMVGDPRFYDFVESLMDSTGDGKEMVACLKAVLKDEASRS